MIRSQKLQADPISYGTRSIEVTYSVLDLNSDEAFIVGVDDSTQIQVA